MNQSDIIPHGWKETTLSEIGRVITGKTPSKNNPEYWGSNLDFITPTDFKSENKLLSTVERKLSPEGKEAFSSLVIPSGSVIVTCIGSDMGKVAINKNYCVTNQQINSLIVNDNFDVNFVYYTLKNSYKILRSYAEGGSTMPIINKSTFEKLQFYFPSLHQQKAIPAVLSSLDDKIELLREQNKTLEAIAQAIFKEWFVKFNFPNINGKPYKDNNGKMIESQLGEIPEGWRVGKIADFGNVVCGKTPSKSNPDYFGGDIPFIKIPDMHNQTFVINTEDSLTKRGGNTQVNKFIPENSICVSCIATVGLVSITSTQSQTNQQINSILPSYDYSGEYLYFALSGKADDLISLGSGGSATLNINTNTFSNVEILVPSEFTLKTFHNLVSPTFQTLKFNLFQIRTLQQLRDKLLPKLISGELRVNTL